jgi:hypothetical protein
VAQETRLTSCAKKDHPVALVSVVRGSNARPPFRGRKNKMTSRSAIKQVGIAAALGLASVLTCVSPASAATDIMKAEPFNANKLMLSICNGRTTTSHWRLNVQTGELVKLTPARWPPVQRRLHHVEAALGGFPGPLLLPPVVQLDLERPAQRSRSATLW